MKRTTLIMLAMFVIAAWSLSAQVVWTDFINLFSTGELDYCEYCSDLEIVGENIYIIPTIYYHPGYTSLVQVNRSNGQVGWRRDWAVDGGYIYPKQLITTPDGQLMLVENRRYLRKVDVSTGESIWVIDDFSDGRLYHAPGVIINIDGYGNYIIAISPNSGQTLWDCWIGDNIVNIIARGTVGEQNQNLLSVFLQSIFINEHVIKISRVDMNTADPEGSPTPILVWQTTVPYEDQEYQDSFILSYGGTLYSITGIRGPNYPPGEFWLNKIDPNTGEILWNHPLDIHYDIIGMIEDRAGGVLIYGQDVDQQKPKIQNYNGSGELIWSFIPDVSAEYLPANFGDACWYNNHLMLSGAAGAYTGLWELAIPGNAVEDTTIPAIDNIACYPNPFRDNATIKFKQTVHGPTTITVYNIKGQLIKTLTDQPFNSGEHDVTWDGKDDQGQRVSPGLYLYKVKSGTFCTSGKMILMK